MDEARRRHYLKAMGIQAWLPRTAAGEGEAATAAESVADEVRPAPVPAPPAGPPPDAAPARQPETVDEPPPWLEEAPPPSDDWQPAGPREEEPPLMVPDEDEIARLDWDALEYRVAHCELCELSRTRTNPVFGTGDRNADLMVIGEAPGAEEDRQGEPFVGRAGQLLNAMLLAIGLQREQVYIANILKCRPPGNRDPRLEEALKCEPYLRRQVALVRPRVILAVGRVAAQNLLKTQEAVGRMRGREYRYDGIPVVVSYHPAYLLRSPDQKGRAWQDLQRVMRLLEDG